MSDKRAQAAEAVRVVEDLVKVLLVLAAEGTLEEAIEATTPCCALAYAGHRLLANFKSRADVPKDHPLLAVLERGVAAASSGATVNEFLKTDGERN